MTNRKPTPGMLTYDDGRPYGEHCREVMMRKGPRCNEVIVDAETMKKYLDNIPTTFDL